jgi:hypothetical protein
MNSQFPIQLRPKWFLIGAAFLGLACAAFAEDQKVSEAAAAYSALLKRADSRPTDVPKESHVPKEGITWPQYFDGKVWNNEIGKDFAMRNLPTVALVDKAGLLRFVNARNDFADKVKQLLAE